MGNTKKDWTRLLQYAVASMLILCLVIIWLNNNYLFLGFAASILSALVCLIGLIGFSLAFRGSAQVNKSEAPTWLVIGLSLGFLSIMDLIKGFGAFQPAIPSLQRAEGDVHILFYAVFCSGIFLFPRQPSSVSDKIRLFLEFGILFLSAGLFFWAFVNSPSLIHAQVSSFTSQYSLVIPVIDVMVIWQIHKFLSSREHNSQIPAQIPMLAGFSMLFIADTLFSYKLLTAAAFNENIAQGLWILGRASLATSGLFQARYLLSSPGNPIAQSSLHHTVRVNGWAAIFPYLWVVAMYGLLVFNYHAGYLSNFEMLTWGVGVILLMVIARQVFSQFEISRLLEQLENANLKLEEHVSQRTQELETLNHRLLAEISSKDQAMDGLAISETHFRTLVEQIPAVTYFYDVDNLTQPSYVSPQIEVLLGNTSEHWKSQRWAWDQSIHPEDKERVVGRLKECLDSEEPFRAEYRLVALDGSVKWVEDRANWVRNAKGQISWWQGIILDVTRRIAVFENLKYQSTLIENVSDAIFSTGVDDQVLSWNQAAERIYGWRAEEVLGRRITDFIQPAANMEQGTSGLEAPLFEELLQHCKDGSTVHIQTSVTPIMDPSGRPTRAIFVNRDISSSKKNEELLERYRLLFARARDVILFVRLKDGRILECNQAAELEYGYLREKLLTLRITDLRSPDTLSQVAGQMRQANSDGILFESLHRRKDGSVFPVEVNSIGTDFDGERSNLSIIRNISKRKDAENAARSAHLLLEKTFASLEEIIIVQDPNNKIILQVNSACQRILGYSPIELIGSTPRCLFNTEEEYENWGQRIKDALEKIGSFHAEIPIRTKDGGQILAEMSINDIRDDSNLSVGFVGSLHDITQRREAENALRASEARYKALFKNMNEGIAVIGFQSMEEDEATIQFLEANPAFLQLLDLSRKDISTTKIEDIFSGDKAIWAERYRKVALYGESLEFHEYYRPLGKYFNVMAFCPEPGKFGMLLLDITEQKRAEKDLRDYADRLQALSRRLLNIQEDERRHLGRELHDEIGQGLTGLKYTIEASIEKMPDSERSVMNMSLTMVNDLILLVRELSLNLRPPMLDDFGLVPALIWLCDRCRQFSGLEIIFEQTGLEARLPSDTETGAYRIVQEALTNIIRHAETHQATVRIWKGSSRISLQILDRGKGFDVTGAIAAAQSAGLSGILERARLLNGDIQIESNPGEGTNISGWLPIELSQAKERL